MNAIEGNAGAAHSTRTRDDHVRERKLRFASCVAVTVLALSGTASSARAQTRTWDVPVEITPKNASIKFEVDSTWHRIHGTAQELTGRLWLANPGDPLSLQAQVTVPVAKLDTDNSSRDERMREVMQEPKYTQVTYLMDRVEGLVSPDALRDGVPLDVVLKGRITIRDVTKPLAIKAQVKKSGERISIDGKTALSWAEFGVEDPSILVAKLDKMVEITLHCDLSSRSG